MSTEEVHHAGTDSLAVAIEAVSDEPTDPERWDRVEELLEADQRPTDVRALFQRVLSDELEPEQASEIGKRGVRFYETWYGGDNGAGLSELLERVLRIDPRAHWAFERLTVAYTVSERWDALLDAYDHAIEQADQTSRRMQLLDEAAQAAKDFANQPDRAIGYMQKLHALDPENAALASALERLLERTERWQDLVSLWESRLGLQSAKQARDTRVRIARCYFENVGDPAAALQQLTAVLGDAPEHAPALEVLERILGDAEAPAGERRQALELLKQHFIRKKKPKEVVRVMETGLDCIDDSDKRAMLRELVERLCDLGEDARAMQHQASLLELEPMPAEREALRVLAERTHDHALYADSLVAAADACDRSHTAADLVMEAARCREQQLGDEGAAIALYERVFESEVGSEVVVEAGRSLVRLLEKTERARDTLAVISRMSELEPEDAVRRNLLGKLARLAQQLGDGERALSAWQARVSSDPQDVEALDALISAADSTGHDERLCELLQQRIAAPGAAERRREDMVWLARAYADRLGQLDHAIDVWQAILASFGEDTETVSALTELLSRAERWPELAEVLSRAAARQTERFTELQTRLGDAYRKRLDQAEQAATRYRSALQVDPGCEGARLGQRALVSDERCREAAIESLAAAYEQTEEWENTLSLLEARIEIAGDAAAASEVLLEAAELYEQRANDPQSALSCLARAFALMPDDRATEKEIRRLAERLDAWQAVVQAYRETIATFERPTPRTAELRFDEGQVLEQHLGDREAALQAYAAAVSLCPERLEFALCATRLSAQLSRWQEAVGYPLITVSARDAIDHASLETLEQVAAETEAFHLLTEAMAAALEQATSDLRPALVHELHARVASWYLDQRGDEAGAEAALLRAVAADSTVRDTLARLAGLQRRALSPEDGSSPRAGAGEALVETLLHLAATDERDLDALLEAAQAAQHSGLAAERLRELDQRLFEAAAHLLSRGIAAIGQATAEHCVQVAVERLVAEDRAAGRHKEACELLLRTAELPLTLDLRIAFRRGAAEIAARDLGDNLRAIALYRDLWQLAPDDQATLAVLADLYKAEDRLPELLMLRRHQLTQVADDEQKLALRLELAELLGEMETRGDRLSSLKDNLRDKPGHPPTIAAISALLRQRGRLPELAELLEAQANALGHSAAAGDLMRRAAELLENELKDADGAIRTYSALYALQPEGDASESLARIFIARGEHSEAARWLELRLGTAPSEGRAAVAVDLAKAHLQAGHRERARGCLEQALHEDAGLGDARELLASIYREDGAWDPLAQLLVDSAGLEQQPELRLSLLTEAANLYFDTLQAPERAVEALEQASELSPGDGDLHLRLGEALRKAGRYQEAQAVLERLIARLGRKRSPERAELHYQLARVLRDAGEPAAAFEQLEAATQMDLAHVDAVHMLARLSQEQGDLERAERAYRGLLLLVRRQSESDGDIGPAEVSFELSRIAVQREQPDQAAELLESAMEAAMQSEAGARRFQAMLRTRGETELLMRLLDARLSRASDASAEAEILAVKAETLSGSLGQPQKALEALLKAVKLDPDQGALHEAACKVALEVSDLDRYLETVRVLSEELRRKRGKANRRLAERLTLRLGEVIEQQLGDLDRAAGLYAKVEASGECVIDAWLALARVSGARGDAAEQRRVLMRIAELDSDEVTAPQRASALFSLAEVELQSAEHREAGIASLRRAVEMDQGAQQAKPALRRLAQQLSDDEEIARLFERVARRTHDDVMLLEAFERRVVAGAPVAELREGIELALRIGEDARAEAMLERAAALARSQPDERAATAWVFAALGECRRRAGDVKQALQYMGEAVENADGSEADAMARDLAQLAQSPDGDLEVAVRVYEQLLHRDPTDRSLWEPLLDVYRRTADQARFEGFVERCLEVLRQPEDRVVVQLARARFLIEVAEDDKASVPVLRALLEDQPGNIAATDLLTQIYQRHNMSQELAELLLIQFDRARDEREIETVAELGLRIAGLYGDDQPQEALDALRAALQWAPEHEGLLRAMLDCLGPDGDMRERAEAMHSLLKAASGDEAARLSRELLSTWSELGDEARALEALRIGVEKCGEDEELHGQLEALYAEREMWRPLAQLLERDAVSVGGAGGIARLKNAANLYRERLEDLEAAAGALRSALEIDPDDRSLLGELARNLAAAGQHGKAIEDVDRLLAHGGQSDDQRVELLKVRADLKLGAERVAEAVQDLEATYAIAPDGVGDRLIEALEMLKTNAFTTGDLAVERQCVVRLIEVHDGRGDQVAARETLAGWLEQDPRDLELLGELRARDEAVERWDDVAATCERMLEVAEGEARLEAAVAMGEALQRAGRADEARQALERAHAEAPDHDGVRARLRELYEATGASAELAAILLAEAHAASDVSEKITLFQRAARLYLDQDDAPAALEPLGEASRLDPDDEQTRVLLIDIQIKLGRLDEASEMLDEAIEGHKRRRSPELAVLQQRMARVAAMRGDNEAQLGYLSQALETHRKSPEIAAELAETAISLGHYDAAMKALRTITMMEDPQPITRAMAFLKQAQIAQVRGDPRRAQHWARKAKSLDENLAEADAFLAELGE